MNHTSPIDVMTRGKVVSCIYHRIGFRDKLQQSCRIDAFFDCCDLDVWIDAVEGLLGRDGFGKANGMSAMNDLPLQIGQVNLIAITDDQVSDAAGGEIHRHRRTQAASTYDEYT